VLEPNSPLKWGWVMDGLCEHLEAVTYGQLTRLLSTVPPGSMKSLLTGVFWPAWEWGPKGRPGTRIVGTAHEEDLAIRDSRKMRDLVKSDWYQNRWEVNLRSDLDGKKEFGNDMQGIRQARAFPSITGVRGDRVVLDDPISAEDANSPAKLKRARRIFTEALGTRMNNDDSAIVVIMQRLNQGDIAGVIDELELPYEKFCVPMEFEPDRKCVTSIGWEDPRTEEGELMFPERFGRARVEELKKTLGSYGAAGQLQQRPVARGGNLIKSEWWQYWEVLPELTHRVIYADTAQKKQEQHDFSVFQVWGKSTFGQAVLIDQVRGKWDAPELLVQAKNFWKRHRKIHRTAPLRSMKVEDKSSGTGLIQSLRKEGMPIIPIQRHRDKYSRAMDVMPYIESGQVLLPKHASWVPGLLAEASAFPSPAEHDDQLDPMFDAVSDIIDNNSMPRLRVI